MISNFPKRAKNLAERLYPKSRPEELLEKFRPFLNDFQNFETLKQVDFDSPKDAFFLQQVHFELNSRKQAAFLSSLLEIILENPLWTSQRGMGQTWNYMLINYAKLHHDLSNEDKTKLFQLSIEVTEVQQLYNDQFAGISLASSTFCNPRTDVPLLKSQMIDLNKKIESTDSLPKLRSLKTLLTSLSSLKRKNQRIRELREFNFNGIQKYKGYLAIHGNSVLGKFETEDFFLAVFALSNLGQRNRDLIELALKQDFSQVQTRTLTLFLTPLINTRYKPDTKTGRAAFMAFNRLLLERVPDMHVNTLVYFFNYLKYLRNDKAHFLHDVILRSESNPRYNEIKDHSSQELITISFVDEMEMMAGKRLEYLVTEETVQVRNLKGYVGCFKGIFNEYSFPGLGSLMEKTISPFMKRVSKQDINILASVLYNTRTTSLEFIENLQNEFFRRSVGHQSIKQPFYYFAITCLSFARLGTLNKKQVELVSTMFENVLPEMSPEDQMKIGPLFLSFAMLTSQGYEGLEEANDRLALKTLEVLLSRPHGVVEEPQTVFQLYKAIQYYKKRLPLDEKTFKDLERTCAQFLKSKAHVSKGQEAKLWQNRFHKMVSRLANRENMETNTVESEVTIDPHGLIPVDIMVNNKAVIELNGPHHFITKEHIRKPIDRINKEIVKSLGYQYHEINYLDWNEMKNQEQREILTELLKKITN